MCIYILNVWIISCQKIFLGKTLIIFHLIHWIYGIDITNNITQYT